MEITDYRRLQIKEGGLDEARMSDIDWKLYISIGKLIEVLTVLILELTHQATVKVTVKFMGIRGRAI